MTDFVPPPERPASARLSLRRLTLVGLLVVLGLALVTGLITYIAAQGYHAASDWVSHTHHVQNAFERLGSQLKDVETGARGFALTGDQRFLDPYRSGTDESPRTLAELRRLTVDNADQQRRLTEIATLVDQRLASAREVIRLRTDQGAAAAAAQIESGIGRRLMDRLGDEIAAAEQTEARLLGDRVAVANAQSRASTAAVLINVATQGAIVVVGGWLMLREQARREQAAVALARSEPRWQLATDGANDAIWDNDRVNDRLYFSPRLQEILALPADQMPRDSATWATRIHPDDLPGFIAAVTPFTSGKAKVFSAEYRVRDGHGDWRWLQARGAGMSDADGRVVRTVGSLRDISDSKQAELDLRATLARLERSNRELGDFAHAASHDLQEPLRMVASYCELLGQRYRGRLDTDADEFIAFAVDGARRMKELIQDLLAFARVDYQGGERTAAASGDALDLAAANLATAIGEAGAVIARDELPTVFVNRMQLAQLFQNLVGNAIKYRGEAAPRIRIGAARLGETWEFTVADNGIGIDPKHHQRIFGIFKRLHGQGRYPGNGIGLSICQKIVELHGGRIWVTSAVGQGATFHFTIPDQPKPRLRGSSGVAALTKEAA